MNCKSLEHMNFVKYMDQEWHYYQIGPFSFSLKYPGEIQPPDNFLLFRKRDEEDCRETSVSVSGVEEWKYEVRLTDELPPLEGDMLADNEDLQVSCISGMEMRRMGIRGSGGTFYASYRETSNHMAEIYLKASEIDGLRYDTIFNSLLALERRLIDHDSLILHCSYLDYCGEAILFSAPSGVGKSTQSGLWEEYRGARTVNGDRAVIRKMTDQENRTGWIAEGFPVCGSSEICHNEAMPVRAIVMLGQASENTIRRLRPMEAFRELFPQITSNGWNSSFVTKVMDLIEVLIADVPVYRLECTISEEAVICLEEALGLTEILRKMNAEEYSIL